MRQVISSGALRARGGPFLFRALGDVGGTILVVTLLVAAVLVPILNASGRIREFFIMSSQSSCCFGTAPRLFDFIDATMPEGTDIKDLGDPVVFEGVLHVRRTPAEDEWIPLFTMDAEAVYRD